MGHHKNDNNNRMIQYTDSYCLQLKLNTLFDLQYETDSIIRGQIKLQALDDCISNYSFFG